MKSKLTPIQAIRAKCLDCACNSYSEVKLCNIPSCPLYPYRLGKRPKNNSTSTGDAHVSISGAC